MLQNWKENIQNTSMYFEKVITDRHYTIKKTSSMQEKALCMHVHIYVCSFYICSFHDTRNSFLSFGVGRWIRAWEIGCG